MKLLPVQQGSEAWVAARVRYRCASEAPIVMGASKRMSRAELVRLKATGGEKEFSQWVRDNILERGHEAEADGRALVEREIGQELYSVVGLDESGIYLASFDGMTMDGEHAFEHKLANRAIVAMIEAGELDGEYFWQLEHQALVSGLDRIIFACSDGTPQSLSMMTYVSKPERRTQLQAGWDQFESDVAAYRHVEVLPPPVAEPVHLPAPSIRVDGALTLISNLDVFGKELRAFVDRLPKKPSTDQEFVECEAAIKTLERAEQALKAAEDSALAQTASVEQMRRAVAGLNELARSNRLMTEKLVKARKETIRAEIIQAGRDALSVHIAALNKRLGRPFMPPVLTDFPGVVKGKKTVQSLRDAIDGELTRAKLVANEVADLVQINFEALQRTVGERMHLFPDAPQLVLKPTDDMMALIGARIATDEEQRRRREEAERERIRAQEIARIEREQAAAAAAAKAVAEAAQPGQAPAPATLAPVVVAAELGAMQARGVAAVVLEDRPPLALFALSARRDPDDEEGRWLLVHFNRRPSDGEIMDLVRGFRL